MSGLIWNLVPTAYVEVEVCKECPSDLVTHVNGSVVCALVVHALGSRAGH